MTDQIGDWAVPGAQAYRYNGGLFAPSAYPMRITRVTKTQVIVIEADSDGREEFRYRRADGREVGGGHDTLLLHPADGRVTTALANRRAEQVRGSVWRLLESKGHRDVHDVLALLSAVRDMVILAVQDVQEWSERKSSE